jgi:uncharacterized protein (UPF0335 family)
MVDGALLHRTISEYERLDAERMATQESQAEVIKGAVEQGLDKTILKRLIRELRRDAALMRAERDLLDEYRDAWLTWEDGTVPPSASRRQATCSARKRGADHVRRLVAMAVSRPAAFRGCQRGVSVRRA